MSSRASSCQRALAARAAVPFRLVLDATHPFATQVQRELADGCRQAGVPLLRTGQVVVNRCPECSRIVKTPLARQCLWCGYDWHGA